MQTVVTDRTHHLAPEVREYAEQRVGRLGNRFDLVTAAGVEFDLDVKKRREPLHVVKINLHLVGHRLQDLHVTETGRDQRVTFDQALARIEAEVVQLKERVQAHP
jgi:ribosomal subunit interface protein